MKAKIGVKVTGVVQGFPYDDESLVEAQVRLVLEAEQYGNGGKARIHLSADCGVQDSMARALATTLRQIFDSLPTNKDWLDPQIEQVGRELIKEVLG